MRVFSTAGLPDARRTELWEAHNATALIGLDVHAPRPLEATEVNARLAHVELARVTGSPHVVQRTKAVIGRAPLDAVAVYLPVRGSSVFHSPERSLPLAPGAILACATDRPFARDFPDGLEELVVKAPRQAIEARAGGTGLPGPVTQGAGTPYARALGLIVSHATRAGNAMSSEDTVSPEDNMSSEGTVPVEQIVLDLVAVIIGGQRAARTLAHRAAARAYIEEHLTDPNLSATEIAAAIGISERQLTRVFAADGTSVPRYVLGRRLDLARSLLTGTGSGMGSGMGGGTVAEVAARCGFTSAAYFSHVFRRRFGMRASELRFSAI